MSSKEILVTLPSERKAPIDSHAFRVEGKIEVSDGLFRFLQALARDLWFDTTEKFVAFVMEDYARLLLTENKKRLGELMAQSAISGHGCPDMRAFRRLMRYDKQNTNIHGKIH